MVLIGFTDERGEHEIALSTIETADLIGALRTSLEEAVGSERRSPAFGTPPAPYKSDPIAIRHLSLGNQRKQCG